MRTLEESVVLAMDGEDTALFPFLPYILQDSWEIGSDPDIIIHLIGTHFKKCDNLEILDLGCGKGAVSVKLAREFGCSCFGIDAIPEFTSEAIKKAEEYDVQHLCKFEQGDIRQQINVLTGFDIVILGSIGPVFGNYLQTLTLLANCLKENGIFIIDDGYIEDDGIFFHPLIQKKKQILHQIDSAGMMLAEECIFPKEDLRKAEDILFEPLKRRCHQLAKKFPDKQQLFENYVQKQQYEFYVLANKVVCSTMLIKKRS